MIIDSGATGQEIRRSRVRVCPSHGKITGEIAVAVKNSVILRRPAIRKGSDTDLFPIKNAIQRNIGIRIPDMSTGGL